VIDQNGCPVDRIFITGMRFSADLHKAYAESHVLKFADKAGVWFHCNIQVCADVHQCRGVSACACTYVYF
jgi:hypothetical protein